MDQKKAPERLHRLPAVIDRVGLARATIYGKIAAGEFPTAVKLGERAVAWRESDIDAWIDSRAPTGPDKATLAPQTTANPRGGIAFPSERDAQSRG